MDIIKELIMNYLSEETQKLDDPDRSKKPAIIKSLEEYASDVSVLAFMLQVASDRTELDLARIEALKVLEIRRPIAQREHERIAAVLKEILQSDKDDDVRSYAAIAAASYMAEKSLREEVTRVLGNKEEDRNLRWNAFTAIERMGRTAETVEIMRIIGEDPEFLDSARRILASWHLA